MPVFVCGHTYSTVCVYVSEDNLDKLVLPFHYVGPAGQVVWLGDKCTSWAISPALNLYF